MRSFGLVNSGLWVYTPRREAPQWFSAYRAFFLHLKNLIDSRSLKDYDSRQEITESSRVAAGLANQNAGHC